MSASAQTGGWVPDLSSFGARLAVVRQRMGWGNVKEAAVACGVPVGSWRSWERDGRQPRNYLEACQRIAARTGCSLTWLALGPGPGAPRPVLPSEPNNDTYRSPVRAIDRPLVLAKDHDAAAARAA